MRKPDDRLDGSYQSHTSRTDMKQYNQGNQSLIQFQHFYVKTERNTETPEEKTLNNTLVTANEG